MTKINLLKRIFKEKESKIDMIKRHVETEKVKYNKAKNWFYLECDVSDFYIMIKKEDNNLVYVLYEKQYYKTFYIDHYKFDYLSQEIEKYEIKET